ncbi:hypothetical protein C8Q79DRAFT_1077354 [Trametes meyenii]|nr:hypothetical protein C8Q79DRAFT_1077354 [Trametes meyenii]
MFAIGLATLLCAFGGSISLAHPASLALDSGVTTAAAVNGSCISAPDTSCISLVGLCVAKVATGQVIPPTRIWSDRICTASAMCAGMGEVLDAVCCAGTCQKPEDQESLDYNNVYFSMVGNCAFQSGGCPLAWQPFVDWFYDTIQSTGTELWPSSGDDVLQWWGYIANWTRSCTEGDCAGSTIPYLNLNDWFHFSSEVYVTAPGTPQYDAPLSTDREENEDDWDPDFSWPCMSEDPSSCWWDYGSPNIPGSQTDDLVLSSRSSAPHGNSFVTLPVNLAHVSEDLESSSSPVGRAPYQPPNIPPPVYVHGQLMTLHASQNNTRKSNNSMTSSSTVRRELHDPRSVDHVATKTVPEVIIPSRCPAYPNDVDIPSILPTLTYYCNKLPTICENIRAHPDWDQNTDTMDLTYDPFNSGKRRNAVCGKAVRDAFQASGQCDLREHNPDYWKISCDEFPFNMVLEGGRGNAHVMAVPSIEQAFQATLNSMLTNLLRVENVGSTVWKGQNGRRKRCHRFALKLLDQPEQNAPVTAVGSVERGSAFWANEDIPSLRFVTDSRVLTYLPATFPVDTAYPPDASALTVMGTPLKPYDCQPCALNPPSPSSPSISPRELSDPAGSLDASLNVTQKTLEKRQVSCSSATLATTVAEATAAAAVSVESAKSEAAAAAAALSSASDVPPAQSSAAAAAIASASALAPAAAALVSATSDSERADAIAASSESVTEAQSAASAIWASGPSISDAIAQVANHVISASSAISAAIASSANVINPQTPISPPTDPAVDPTRNRGNPSAPPAACFGAGSTGFLKVGNSYFGRNDTKAKATLIDAGSKAYFGLSLSIFSAPVQLEPIDGCNAVYFWGPGQLEQNFQVDCSTNELRMYWNGIQQSCYYWLADPNDVAIFCGSNIANIISCVHGQGVYADLQPAFLTWTTS